MILRLSQKLCTKAKVGKLEAEQVAEHPITDWSATLFRLGRIEYILLCNTSTLYSCVTLSKGVNNSSQLVARVLQTIQESMIADAYGDAFERFIAPASKEIRFAKALNRTVIGSMNELILVADCVMSAGDISLAEVGSDLNCTLLSALGQCKRDYGEPKEAFAKLVESLG